MANKSYPNIQHLKQGQTIPDPIHKAKLDGVHFSDTARHVTVTPTGDSKPGACDGYLAGKNSPDGGKGWAPINDAAKPNTYTGKGGSKRD
jgi:hypothetical protein